MTTALRPTALAILLFCPAAVVAQMAGFANNPYTATKKTTLVQKLADGTTITRVTTETEARDSQGRTMHQQSMTGLPGRNVTHTDVMDPSTRTTTMWMSTGKEATRTHMPDPQRMQTPSGSMGNGTDAGVGSGVMGGVVTSSSVVASVTGSVGVGMDGVDPNLRPARKTEKLGGKTIAGIYAEGVRMTITYPIGFMGNDRPIVNVREIWTSPDLRLVVLNTDDDPRSGLRTIELTNLDRAEPDPALFQVPEGYTIKDQYPGSN